MSGPFNPDAPDVLGLQWFPTGEPAVTLDIDTAAAGAKFTATATETIAAVWVGLDDVSLGFGDGWELEVYELPLASSGGNLQTATFVPTADAVNGTWGWLNSTQVDPPAAHWQLIDNTVNVAGTWIPPGDFAPVTPGYKALFDQDFIAPIFGLDANWAGYFGGATGVFTTERILAVRQVATVQEFLTEFAVGQSGVTFVPYVRTGGHDYPGASIRVRGEKPSGTEITTEWWRNPTTECGWSASDIDDFAATSALGWKMMPSGSPHDFPAIFKARMEVLYTAADIRTARGCLTDPTPGWNRVELDANWAKASGTEYVIVLRRRSTDSWIKWRYLTGDDPPQWKRVKPRVNSNGRRLLADATGRDANFGATLDGAHAILLEVDGSGDTSVDGQPYFSVNGDVPTGHDPATRASSTEDWCSVHTGKSLFQGVLAPGSTADRGFIRLLVRQDAATVDGDLTLKIKRDSDDLQFGSTETITSDDLVPSRMRWQVVERQMAAVASLASATDYYVELSSTATDGSGWQVQVLSTILEADPGGPPSDVHNAALPSFAAEPTSFDADKYDELTAAVTLHTLPAAVTNFAVSVVMSTTCLGHIHLSWTATALGADFSSYQVDRLGRDGLTWERIAEITDEAVTSINDKDARRGVAEYYRIRVRRMDHAASVWSALKHTTRLDGCCGYVFTGNEIDGDGVWADDVGNRSYTPVERGTELQFEGRDGTVGYYELEDRLDQFDVTLLIGSEGGMNGTEAVPIKGRRAFDDLLVLCGNKRDIATSEKITLSAVTVLDSDGNRWYARVKTGGRDSIKRSEPGGVYTADVTVIETTTVPPVIDARS